MAKRDIILAEIRKGGATKESLMVAAEVNEKGLASQMTYLRLMGTCPRKMEDNTYEIVSREVWDEHRAASGAKSDTSLTPAERLEKAEKKVNKAITALDRATESANAAPDDDLKALKFQVAKLNVQIASIEQGQLEEQFRDEVDAKGDAFTEGEEIEEAEDNELE